MIEEPEGTEVVDDDQIEDEVASPEETGSEEAEVPGEPAAEDPEEVAEGETPEPGETERSEQSQVAGVPFSFRVSGRDVAVEGSEVLSLTDGDGNPVERLVITPEGWNRGIQPYLQDASAIAKRENELLQRIETLDPANNETVVRAQALLDNFEQIISSEDALTEFLSNFDTNKEVLKLKAEKAARDAADGLRTSREETQTSADREAEIIQQIDDDFSPAASGIYAALNLDISDDVKNRIGERMWERRHDFYRYATEADVRDHPNVSVGEVVLDTDRVADEIRYQAGLVTTVSGRSTKTEQARKKNAAALTPKEPPATVPATGSPAPGKKVKDITSKEEWEAEMGLN